MGPMEAWRRRVIPEKASELSCTLTTSQDDDMGTSDNFFNTTHPIGKTRQLSIPISEHLNQPFSYN